jgi:hypothetical protein
MRAALGQVAAVDHNIGRCLTKIGQYCLEGDSIAVNV